MKGKLIYLFLWLVIVYLGILYYSRALLGLAALEFFLPVISFLLLQIAVRKMQIRPCLSIGVAEKNQPVQAGIEIEMKHRIPLPRIRVEFTVRNHFYDQTEQVVLWGMAYGRKTRITKEISSEHCGLLILEIKEVKIYDIFRIFSRKKKVREKETLAVLPEYYEAAVFLRESTRNFLEESEEYDKNRAGDDPSEVFQIREYHGGDRMQSIHWKLSARTDELMVKEYSLPVGNPVVVFWDMQIGSGETTGYLDEYLEAGLALSQGLLQAGCEHYAVWFNKKQKDLERIAITEPEDIYLLTERIFSAGPYEEKIIMEELYREKYRGETWHTQLLFNLKKELWKNGQLEMELSGCARDVLTEGVWV